ncbi:MAG: hypothetical protein CL842_06970 [Crocinitomicaceae bacterium]|nr:hypothetical protein [Crocinitomicaceae bacterium]
MIYNFIDNWNLKYLLVLIMFAVSGVTFGQDYKNEKQLIKGADDQFESKNYKEAISLYSTLVSNYPKDPTYNYKYGASLLYGSADKEKPIKYLKFSVSRPEVEPIAYFYYAEALHLNYEFDQAIKYYKKFTNSANNSTIKRNTVENQIRQCENGKTLLKTINDLIVLDQKNTLTKDFYKVYDLSAQGGQILVKTDDFRSPYEMKNNINGLFYFPKNAQKIFFSSHTFENKDGKDLYYAVRNDDGSWSKPISLGKTINTEFNEDFPYMSADASTLYFASEGHNSLGGYDIFVSRLDTSTGSWTVPQNLDFAINTPANDYLFIPNLSGETAYFASERQTPIGEVSVYQINMERVPLDFTFIFGTFSSETTKNATIKVEDASTNAIIGEYPTDQYGKYKIKLPNDGKFRFLVDYEGSEVTHSGEVDLQDRNTFKPLKQEMLVMGQGTENEKLIIKNLVDEEVAEDVELTAEFFKEKAKLKINKDKFKDRKPKVTTPVGGEIADASVVPGTEDNSSIAENAEHAGKAATSISDEKVISNSTVITDGPELVINEDPGNTAPKLSNEDGSELSATDVSEENGSTEAFSGQTGESETGTSSQKTSNSGTNTNSGIASNTGSSAAGIAGAGVNSLGSTTSVAGAAVVLKPSSSSSKEEVESAMQDNLKVADNSAKMIALQGESALNIADRKSTEAEQLKSEANNELALIDIETEDGLNSPEYADAQDKLKKANKLDRQATVARNAAASLSNNKTALEQTIVTGTQKQKSLNASTTSDGAEAVGDYNELIEAEADQAYNIYDEREKAEAAHKKEEKEHKHFADELAALHSEIEDSEQIIAQKEAALESASKKEKKAIEEELINERAALATMVEKSRIDEQELMVLEAEAKEEEAELEAYDAIIEELERNESYTELAAAPNLIDGAGSVNENRSTGSSLIASGTNKAADNSKTAENLPSNSEESEQSSAASTEEGTAQNANGTAGSEGSAVEENTSVNADEALTIAEKVANEKARSAATSNQESGGGFDPAEAYEDVQGANENSAEVIGTVEHESGEEMIAQKRTSSSQDEVDLLNEIVSAPLAVAVVPTKYATVDKTVPEIDSKMALFPDMEEGDTLSESDKALMPSEGNTATAFIPENTLASLENEDQSLRTQMKSNYHATYLDEFFELAEEEDEYTKSVNTYVLNQSWLLDIEKEIGYLESIQDDVPADKFTVVQERINVLEGFKDTKLNDLESSKANLDAATPQENQNAGEIASDYRSEMSRVFEGKRRLSSEEIAIEEQRRDDVQSQRKTEMAGLVAQNEAESQARQNSGNDNSTAENEAENGLNAEIANQENVNNSQNESNTGTGSNAEDNRLTADNGVANDQGANQKNSSSNSNSGNGNAGGATNQNASSNAASSASNNNQGNSDFNAGTPGAGAASIAYSDKGEIIPNQKEDKLANVLDVQNAGTVEAVVTDYTYKVEKEETLKKELIETETTAVQEKQKEYALAKRKQKVVLEAELREEEQALDLLEQEVALLAYNKQAVARAADNILALEPGEEKDSEKELKKAETLVVQAQDIRAEAETKAVEKVRGKKKTKIKLAEVDDLNHKADKLDFEANNLKKLSKELASVEEDVLLANQVGEGDVTLPKPTRQISQAEVQEVQSLEEYKVYDATRKDAVKSYKAAQVLYSEKLSLEAQNKVIDAEIRNVETDMESANDQAQKEELSNKMDELVASKEENTKLMNQKESQSRKKYAEFTKLNNAAIIGLRSAEGENGEKLIALANLAETQGAYSLSGSGEDQLIAANANVGGSSQENAGASQNEGTTETGYSPEKFNRVVQGIDNYPERLSDAIFKMIDFNESLYNSDNPIPMNNTMPTGLVYKVQIGAFRNPPPQDIYKGFAPVRGETSRPGWIRYTAGLFQQKNQAQLKLNEIRTLGYEDAFVVAYLNGERISLSRAKDIETGVEKVPEATSNALASGGRPTPVVPTSAVSGEVKQLSEIEGLMYTVQVGAFRNQITSNELFGISPLIEYRAGDYYKYGSGVYNDINRANDAKGKIQSLGVSDAFVTAFYNGNRVSMEEASKLANGGTSFATEQPVTVNAPAGNNAAGINFRVQVGAYRQEVPIEDAKVILSLSNIGLDTKVDGDMTYYTAGNYGSYAEAKQMQTQVSNQGLSGAFVVALQNGKKIDLQEAIRLTGQ